jgi:hypothetical protein
MSLGGRRDEYIYVEQSVLVLCGTFDFPQNLKCELQAAAGMVTTASEAVEDKR